MLRNNNVVRKPVSPCPTTILGGLVWAGIGFISSLLWEIITYYYHSTAILRNCLDISFGRSLFLCSPPTHPIRKTA